MEEIGAKVSPWIELIGSSTCESFRISLRPEGAEDIGLPFSDGALGVQQII